ncbi:recombinase family protein [Streptomyces sp. NPDC005968]|uniref:recombinase family protein n=2 Tax=unclassified Streptomyces TaxID=2593676 RepID=UPI0033CBB165
MSDILMSAVDVDQRAVKRGQLRAVVYARVSTEEQAKGYGIAAGEKRAKRYIDRKDWLHVRTFADEGVSGSLPWHERPHLAQLMELAQQKPRPFDVVVVPEGRAIGRLGRAYYPWVWKLEDLGVFVADATVDIDNTTDDGRDKMHEEATYAFKEYARIRSRTQGGIQEHAEEGGYTGGYVPFSYRVENMGKKRKSRLVPDETESRTAQRARRLFVEHINWQKTADLLNAERLFTRSGVPWSDANLRNILTGDALLKSRQVFRKKTRAMVDRDGEHLYGEEVVIDLPPIFTEEEKGELKEAILLASRGPSLNRGRIYTLSGRIVCPCGGTYTGWNPTGKREPKYRCNAGGPRCKLLPAEAVERIVWTKLQSALGDLGRLQRVTADWVGEAVDRDVDYEQRLEELATKIGRQHKTIKVTRTVAVGEALDRGLDETAALHEAAEAVRPLNKQLADLVKLRSETTAWQKEATETALLAEDLVSLARMAQERPACLSPEEQARLFTLLDTTVTVTGTAPAGRAGAKCSLAAWFRDRGLDVPTLTDEGWERVSGLFVTTKRVNIRKAVEGMLYKAREGVSWGALPKEYGRGESVREVFLQWQDGPWPQAMDRLGGVPGQAAFDPNPLPAMSIRTWAIPELLLQASARRPV